MYSIRVAGAALNQTALDWEGNLSNILQAVDQAKKAKVTLLCLPELCITGYGCEDAFFAAGTRRIALENLQKIASHCSDITVAVGLPLKYKDFLYNAACLISNQQILGFSCKQFLANDGIHYETRWFKPWPHQENACIEIAGSSYPIGDLCYDLGGTLIGFEICEDAWVADRPGIRLASNAVDIILNPSASHFAFGKFEVRKNFVIEGSKSFSCAYVYSNLVGNEAGRAIYDAGTLIANAGRLVAVGPRFSFRKVVLTEAVIDLKRGGQTDGSSQKSSTALTSGSKMFKYLAPDSCRLSAISESQSLQNSDSQSWEQSESLKEEEFTRAVCLGLFDYMRKSSSRGFVISLSGGADSSAVACLVRFSIALAVNELGKKEFASRLSYFINDNSETELNAILSRMLTTVYQSSENSSELTRNAAAMLAAAVGARHHELSVSDIIARYTALAEQAIGRKLNWKDDDITLQNIQARARAPMAWMFANLQGALLLATSNRSEVAVGYATMDGDTCGSISPIAGIDKDFIRSWLRWVEHCGPAGLGPIHELCLVNNQEPTAELRPGKQTDEDDLMPYNALTFIEKQAVRDKKEPSEILLMLKTQFPSHGKAEHLRWVKLFFTLWSRNQWKRERYAPSFHLDDESLDPKTWCRFPILSGGYKKELSELK